ncbi:uncharacterized protein LOC117282165 [Cryptotermes secundus]|uniref:uncharacterized protein LOC117282165 n=1 Tax=Cryptotermes secundus TaxID=105785 RepID=UPI001454DDBA|nr:uncharacterized protein LOC117282165 [Cryptotermes secundus]
MMERKEDYKNRGLRNKAWEEICSSIIPIFDEADDNLKKKLEQPRFRGPGDPNVCVDCSVPCAAPSFIQNDCGEFVDMTLVWLYAGLSTHGLRTCSDNTIANNHRTC